MNKVAIYPGTFDPITYGHIDVIKKALKLFDRIVVGVSDVSNKNYLFTTAERIDIVNKALFKDLNLDKKKITFSGTFSGETFNITDHGYYSGESIYYTPQKGTDAFVDTDDGELPEETTIISSLFGGDTGGEGVYYVLRVDNNNIKLAKSNANLYAEQFVSVETSTTVVDNIIEDSISARKQLEPQKLYREISDPINNDLVIETKPGTTGILINGVEILNYKSNDLIYYGKLDEVEVVSPGFGFDVINPPILNVKDPVGTGATGFLAVSGSLRNIQIIDRGFDFTEVPIVSITGGNGSDAKASVVTKLISHSVEFFSDPSSARVSLGASLSTIGFSTYHKFREGEQVVYKTSSQKAVGGISTDATYFASIVDATTVKLHNNIGDSISGINTVTLSFFGEGKHQLECTSKKAVIDSIKSGSRRGTPSTSSPRFQALCISGDSGFPVLGSTIIVESLCGIAWLPGRPAGL